MSSDILRLILDDCISDLFKDEFFIPDSSLYIDSELRILENNQIEIRESIPIFLLIQDLIFIRFSQKYNLKDYTTMNQYCAENNISSLESTKWLRWIWVSESLSNFIDEYFMQEYWKFRDERDNHFISGNPKNLILDFIKIYPFLSVTILDCLMAILDYSYDLFSVKELSDIINSVEKNVHLKDRQRWDYLAQLFFGKKYPKVKKTRLFHNWDAILEQNQAEFFNSIDNQLHPKSDFQVIAKITKDSNNENTNEKPIIQIVIQDRNVVKLRIENFKKMAGFLYFDQKPHSLEVFTELKELYLDRNNLWFPNSIKNLQKLEVLSLKGNYCYDVPNWIANFPNLRILDL